MAGLSSCRVGGVGIQRHDVPVNSMYLLSEDAWTYELTGSSYTSSAVAMLALVIPDATPDGEQFTPVDATHAYVTAAEGTLPWPMLRRSIRFVETPGDIVTGEPTATVTGDLVLSLNSWNLVHRVFEVTSYHDGEHDGWCYEVDPANASNYDIDVRIPDLPPADGRCPGHGHDVTEAAARLVPRQKRPRAHADSREPRNSTSTDGYAT
ncbi:hypothetical protein HCB39_27255 [Salinispora arenicola]|nr:hypothetical protein [Salinispora arenicola]